MAETWKRDMQFLWRYRSGEQQTAIARAEGLSQSRVWQIIERAKKREQITQGLTRVFDSTQYDVWAETQMTSGVLYEFANGAHD